METPAPEHQRPDGVSDETVEALGKLSEGHSHADPGRDRSPFDF